MTVCPSTEDLKGFLTGSLPDGETATMRAHVRSCAACQGLLETITDDPELRQWVPADGWTPPGVGEENALTRLLHRWGVPAAPTPASPTSGGGFPGLFGPPKEPGELGTLGPYRIQEELGRGGMGVVFKAFDETLHRPVAVKVLRPDLADATARRRLVREAQLAARFRDDHVITVHAVVDPPDGLPYLVMEYVAGPALNRQIEAQRRLEPALAVAVAIQVADGLAAAHAAGLVHRDIKPNNILLDPATGRVKITDFGLARAGTHASTLSREDSLAGTPAYMSPEQVRGAGALDARTDVYSLGVTLYEALTGELPFQGTPHMVLRQVLDDEPRPPRRLNDAVPADLETVCLKAMAKDAARRYPTARDLADDLRRWQRGAPVRARPVGRLERSWRWCRRNPRVATLSGAVLGLLLLLASGATLAATQIAGAHRAALAAAHQAEANAAAARRAEQQADEKARAASDHFALALDALTALVGGVQDQLGTRAGTLGLQKQLAKTALAGLEKIALSAERTPGADRGRIRAHERLGDLFVKLGDTPQAFRQFDRARQLADDLLATDPDPDEVRRQLASAHDKLGDLALAAHDRPTAEEHYRTAKALREVLAADSSPLAPIRRDLAVSCTKPGDVALQFGDPAGAHRWFAEALAGYAAQAGSPHDPDGLQQALWFTHSRLADVNLALFDYGPAAAHLGRALELAQARTAADPEDVSRRRNLALTYKRLGNLNLRTRAYATAEEAYRQALAIWERLAAADADNADWQRNLAASLGNLADAQFCRGDVAGARASLEKAFGLVERLALQDLASVKKLADVGINGSKLAVLEERAERYLEAAQWIDRIVAIDRRAVNEAHVANPLVLDGIKNFGIDRAVYVAAAKAFANPDTLFAGDASSMPGLLRIQGVRLTRRGRHREAATAAQIRARAGDDAMELFSAAQIYSLCAGAVGQTPEDQTLRQHYAEQAVALLKKILRANPFTGPTLEWGPDWNPIRDTPAFQSLIQEIRQPRQGKSTG